MRGSRCGQRGARAEPSAAPDEVAGPAAYQAHIGANDAAAERWRAEHGGGDATPDAIAVDDLAVLDAAGCPEGTQYWRRDRNTVLCAPLCTGYQDCGPDDGRCRMLDVEEGDDVAAIVIVDDTPRGGARCRRARRDQAGAGDPRLRPVLGRRGRARCGPGGHRLVREVHRGSVTDAR